MDSQRCNSNESEPRKLSLYSICSRLYYHVFYVTGRTWNSKTAAVKSLSVLHNSTDYIFSDTFRTFSAMFSKGYSFRDFSFAYLEVGVLPEWNLFLKERISLRIDA